MRAPSAPFEVEEEGGGSEPDSDSVAAAEGGVAESGRTVAEDESVNRGLSYPLWLTFEYGHTLNA